MSAIQPRPVRVAPVIVEGEVVVASRAQLVPCRRECTAAARQSAAQAAPARDLYGTRLITTTPAPVHRHHDQPPRRRRIWPRVVAGVAAWMAIAFAAAAAFGGTDTGHTLALTLAGAIAAALALVGLVLWLLSKLRRGAHCPGPYHR